MALVLCLHAASAGAHDLWIQPSTFHPAVGELVWIDLRIGHPAAGGEALPRNGRFLERFVLHGPGGETPVPGLEGRKPAGWIRPPAPGPYILALRSREAVSELPAPEFESYLREEGLEGVIVRRARLGESDEPGRERYSRALKALVTVEGPQGVPREVGGVARDRPLGLRLELILLDDPRRLQPAAPLAVELRFEGRPLAGALVEADPLGAPPPAPNGRREPSLRARTDDRGRAVFELPTEGAWLLTAVHMVRAPGETKEDWQSVWTALTFALDRR